MVYELITLISLGPDAAPDGPAYGISGARYGEGSDHGIRITRGGVPAFAGARRL